MGRAYTGTSVYRLYDADDRLLYVGLANRPAERWGTHAGQPWWPLVVRKEITRYPTREEALRVEAAAIIGEDPLHNQFIPNPDGSVRGARLRDDSPALAKRRGPRPGPKLQGLPTQGVRIPRPIWDLYKTVVFRIGYQSVSGALMAHMRRTIQIHGTPEQKAALPAIDSEVGALLERRHAGRPPKAT